MIKTIGTTRNICIAVWISRNWAIYFGYKYFKRILWVIAVTTDLLKTPIVLQCREQGRESLKRFNFYAKLMKNTDFQRMAPR